MRFHALFSLLVPAFAEMVSSQASTAAWPIYPARVTSARPANLAFSKTPVPVSSTATNNVGAIPNAAGQLIMSNDGFARLGLNGPDYMATAPRGYVAVPFSDSEVDPDYPDAVWLEFAYQFVENELELDGLAFDGDVTGLPDNVTELMQADGMIHVVYNPNVELAKRGAPAKQKKSKQSKSGKPKAGKDEKNENKGKKSRDEKGGGKQRKDGKKPKDEKTEVGPMPHKGHKFQHATMGSNNQTNQEGHQHGPQHVNLNLTNPHKHDKDNQSDHKKHGKDDKKQKQPHEKDDKKPKWEADPKKGHKHSTNVLRRALKRAQNHLNQKHLHDKESRLMRKYNMQKRLLGKLKNVQHKMNPPDKKKKKEKKKPEFSACWNGFFACRMPCRYQNSRDDDVLKYCHPTTQHCTGHDCESSRLNWLICGNWHHCPGIAPPEYGS